MEMTQSVSSFRSTVGVLSKACLESTVHAESLSVQGSTLGLQAL